MCSGYVYADARGSWGGGCWRAWRLPPLAHVDVANSRCSRGCSDERCLGRIGAAGTGTEGEAGNEALAEIGMEALVKFVIERQIESEGYIGVLDWEGDVGLSRRGYRLGWGRNYTNTRKIPFDQEFRWESWIHGQLDPDHDCFRNSDFRNLDFPATLHTHSDVFGKL